MKVRRPQAFVHTGYKCTYCDVKGGNNVERRREDGAHSLD